MASLQRKNTVSRSSGPSHINSYALKGLPIKYKTPIFVPQPLLLPSLWKPPQMPSESQFFYDYSVENSVIAQARTRAVSVAAEASLKRQQVEIQRERQEAEAQAARERAPPLFSNDILTPTPVSVSSPSNSNNGAPGETSQSSTDSESPKSTSGVELTIDQQPLIKPLGELSIREFETNFDDPFEMASLQAINDMEVLQSVLQPIPPPILTSANTSTAVAAPTVANQQLTTTEPKRAHSSPIPTPRTKTAVSAPSLYPGITSPSAPVGSPSNGQLMTGVSPSEPGVGVLIDLGGETPNQPSPTARRQSGEAPSQPSPAVRPQSWVQFEQPQGTSASPMPKPRTRVSNPPYPNGPQQSPPIPPKATPTGPTQGGTNPPVLPPKSPASSPSVPPRVPNRPGLGVQVLPPIQSTAQPPPPYSSPILLPAHNVLPPYSSPKQPPKTAPRGYKLPDPQNGLSTTQKSQVQSLSGMGFPPARVARAVLRYEDDSTKVLDFLFAVGQLEEKGHPGDSAETALITCKEDTTKAVEYLDKVAQYKEFGFQEKKIHECYQTANENWDKVLDLLTEGS